MKLYGIRTADSGRRGSAMVIVALLVFVISGLSLAALTLTNGAYREQKGAKEEIDAELVAEAAISASMLELELGGDGVVGNSQQPVSYAGSASYWVEATDLGGNVTSYVGTGRSGRSTARVEVIIQESTDNMFTWGAFGDDSLTMESNAFVDSYNSSLGTYASQEVNGSGSNSYALQNGHVGSNGNVGLRQNAMVQGDAVAGPGSSTTVLGNAVVAGTTTPSTTFQSFPPLDIPALPSAGDLSVAGGSTHTLASGDYGFDDLHIDNTATLFVTGPATLVFDSFTLDSNSSLIVDATNGPVEIFVRNDFVLNSNTLIQSTTATPADIRISLESDNVIDPNETVDLDDVEFESNAELYGTIYAPNAQVIIDSNFRLFGALVARRVHLDSNSRVHFDEALLTALADEQAVTFQRLLYRVQH